jgi:hypothetical protein
MPSTVLDLDHRFMPVLQTYGRHFAVDEQTYAGRRKRPRACFDNAGRIARSHPELHYAEGWFTTHDGFRIHHAWLVNEAGVVRDPTLTGDDQPVDYFGIVFTTEYLCQVCVAANGFGIFQWLHNPMWKMTDAELRQRYSADLRRRRRRLTIIVAPQH